MTDRPHAVLPLRVGAWLIAALVCLACAAAGASEARRTATVKAFQRVKDAVVNIRGQKTVSEPAAGDAPQRVNGMGSGVIIDPRGYIITNHHVVDGIREIQVTLADRTRYSARLVCRDPETDLAIIKIEPVATLSVIAVGTSSDLMTGEPAIAIGNAYGYEHTITAGIVSALHRSVQVSDAQSYDDLIQTSAEINPGNSGGPLLNIDGEMIGINVAVRAGAQGIGFAIPVDKAMAVAADLFAAIGGKKAWHGLALGKEGGPAGVGIGAVEPGSPAESAGLQPGDLVTQVGELDVQRALDFQRGMLERTAGERVPLRVQRGEESLALSLTLARPTAAAPVASGATWETLGLELKPIAAESFRQQFQTRYRGGLRVTAVRPHSPAAEQGIRRNDVLVGMHIWETVSLENVTYIVNRPDFANLNPVKFFILRGNETLYGYLPVAMAPTRRQ